MLRDASQRASAGEAPALASRCDAPQHEGEGAPRILAKRSQGSFGVVPAKAGTHDHRRWLWVPALPSLSRGSAGTTTARAEHQPAAVRNGRRGNSIVFGLLLTMTFATPTCPAAETHV